MDFTWIQVPFQSDDLDFLLKTSEPLQYALEGFMGKVQSGHKKRKLFNTDFQLVQKSFLSKNPIKNALTIFTDGSGASHKSVLTWRNPQTRQWEADVEVIQGSPQVAELAAVVRAFEKFPKPFNLITDSTYVAGVTLWAENSALKETSNLTVFNLLLRLTEALSH